MMTQLIPLTINQLQVLLILYKKPEDGYHLTLSAAEEKIEDILSEEEVQEAVAYLEDISAIKNDMITPKGRSIIASRLSFSLDLFAQQLANNPKLFKRMVSLLTVEAQKQQERQYGASRDDDSPSPGQAESPKTGDSEEAEANV